MFTEVSERTLLISLGNFSRALSDVVFPLCAGLMDGMGPFRRSVARTDRQFFNTHAISGRTAAAKQHTRGAISS